MFVFVVEGTDAGKIKPIGAFGTDFWPDITIEVRGLPVAAIEVKLAKKGGCLADPTRALIGQSVIYSLQHPFVIGFVWNQGARDEERKHWFDEEIQDILRANHRARLLIRSASVQ